MIDEYIQEEYYDNSYIFHVEYHYVHFQCAILRHSLLLMSSNLFQQIPMEHVQKKNVYVYVYMCMCVQGGGG